MYTRPDSDGNEWPLRARRGGKLAWRQYRTPWGEGLVGADADGLRVVELPHVVVDGPAGNCGAAAPDAAATGEAVGPSRQSAVLETWAEALEQYFGGERLAWSADEVPWDELGVRPFEREVYEALLSVAPGETVSYGRLAEMAGHPGAARAVGTAMAANPIPVVIPCHRVIRADGSLGNYGDDPGWKPRLLAHEREVLAARCAG